jgi:hypothetical protein
VHRRRRGRRFTVAALALVVAAVGSIGLYQTLGARPTIIGAGAETTHYVDERSGWTMDYPSAWHLQTTKLDIFEGSFVGVLVSNVDHEFDHPDLGPNSRTSQWDMRGLPAGLVLIDVRDSQGGIRGPAPTDPFTDRLDLDAFETENPGRPAYGAPQPVHSTRLASLGHWYGIYVYFDSAATTQDVQAAHDVVASMRFAPEPEPTNEPSPTPSAGQSVMYTHAQGWTLSHPGDWRGVQEFSRTGRVTYTGAVFTNLDRDLTAPDLGPGNSTSGWDWSDIPDPASGVAIQVMQTSGGASPLPEEDTPLPLDLTDFSPGEASYGSPPLVEATAWHAGVRYTVFAWIGDSASTEDRDSAAAMVESIAFPNRFGGDEQVTMTPPQGRVGDKIEIRGTGFTEEMWKHADGGYGLSLQSGQGCDAIASTEHRMEIAGDGTLTGWFIVPATAQCFQEDRQVPVAAGSWVITIACHVCELDAFEVIE